MKEGGLISTLAVLILTLALVALGARLIEWGIESQERLECLK